MNLKSMPVHKLMGLRSRVEAALTNRVAEKRRTLESELAKLTRATTHLNRGRGGARGGKIAPKYRNPDNPSETWAGRGLKPRWLAAAFKAKMADSTLRIRSDSTGGRCASARTAD